MTHTPAARAALLCALLAGSGPRMIEIRVG